MEHCDFAAIEALLRRHGFHFSKSMGQNFLIDATIPAAIAEASEAGEGNGVLEIGPGIGALSHELCRRANRVVAVELDKALLPILDETMANFDNFEVVSADILKTDIPALVREKLAGLTPIVCANLPYNITTPAITALLESRCFESITVLVQKEVAERLCAGHRRLWRVLGLYAVPHRAASALRGRARVLPAAAESDLRRPARRGA